MQKIIFLWYPKIDILTLLFIYSVMRMKWEFMSFYDLLHWIQLHYYMLCEKERDGCISAAKFQP